MPLELELMNKNSPKGILQDGCVPILLHSQATNRHTYLQRPDLGRRLNRESRQKLQNLNTEDSYDLAIVVVDGLSSIAIKENAIGNALKQFKIQFDQKINDS